MSRSLRRELRYPPLLILLGLAVLVRVATTIFVSHGIIYGWDSSRFTLTATGVHSIFSDFWMPSGYPIYLAGVHLLTDQIWVPIAGQHLLALATAVVLFLTLRRINLSAAVATVGAAVLLVPGDMLFLEHAVLTESLMLPFTVLACCAAIRGLVPKLDYRWLLIAGILAGVTVLFRSAAMVTIPALAIVALLAAPPPWRKRLTSGGVVAATGVIVVVIYAAAGNLAGGQHAGLSDMSGWNLYARVAPFAYCSEFTPPKGTERLCDWTPIDKRPDTAYYAWNFPPPPYPPPSPQQSVIRGRFARAVIKGQPKSYAKAVLTDLARYVDPNVGRGLHAATGPSFMEFDNQILDPSYFAPDRKNVAMRYGGISDPRHGVKVLGAYQRVVRIHGLLLPFLAIIALVGLFRLRGPQRIATGIFSLVSAGLFVVPVLTFSYGYRYGVPPAALLAIAALIAIAGLLEQRSDRPPAPQPGN